MSNPSRTPGGRRAAAIYREAARLIESGVIEYSCSAIVNATGDDEESWSRTKELRAAYVDLFQPDAGTCGWAEEDEPQIRLQVGIYRAAGGQMHFGACSELRVLMLCMMAAVTERP